MASESTTAPTNIQRGEVAPIVFTLRCRPLLIFLCAFALLALLLLLLVLLFFWPFGMQTEPARRGSWHRVERIPFQYALLMTAVLIPKFLHLYTHLHSLPPLLFALYLPTFLAVDVLSAVLFWILVHLNGHGKAWTLLALGRSLIW